jgi:NADPH:quinone reductase-like Zn-dependent oxidoreductase
VHSGAGGVGLAAVRLALQLGAEVYATAGNAEKRAFLESNGVRRAMSSRSLEFADELLQATGGHGVDVVLNSLAEDFIPASLGLLAPGGRFLELGKRDIWTPERVASAYASVRYSIVDLSTFFRDGSELLPELFREFALALDEGLQPLPVTSFPLADAAAAFRYMAQARHTGKVVVTRDGDGPVRASASYLITGGLSGLGLAVAARLAERGARRLVLMGRTAPGEDARRSIHRLEELGVEVVVVRGDVTRRDDVAQAVAVANATETPLRGIVHSAGVLDDGVLANQEWRRFAAVLGPKVHGGWLLHEASRELELDWFVLFASAAGVLGSTAQANHAAANAFLDGLAHHRRALGLPAISLDWGAWSELGAAAERDVVERVAGQGIGAISPEDGLEAFERCLTATAPQVLVAPVDWGRYLERVERVPAFLSELAAEAPPQRRAQRGSEQADGILAELAAAPPARRRELLLAYVSRQAGRALGLDEGEEVPERRPLQELGFDSLMAVEFRNLLGAGLALERPLPATLVFDYPTISAIVGYFEKEILSPAGHDAVAADGADDLLGAIEQLSEEEVDRLLAERGGDRATG